MITDVVPIPLDVPRDRDGSFAPRLVRKRQRRRPIYTALNEADARAARAGATTNMSTAASQSGSSPGE